jgi:hypothetical protein
MVPIIAWVGAPNSRVGLVPQIVGDGGVVITLASLAMRRAASVGLIGIFVAACASSSTTEGLSPNTGGSPSPTGRFVATGSMATARYQHKAVRLLDGRVLLLAGIGDRDTPGPETYLASCEIYDPRTGVFITSASLGHPTQLMEVLPLPSGRVLIEHESDLGWTIEEEYDPTTDRVVGVQPLTISGVTGATVLHDGRLLLAGNVTSTSDHSLLATASIYDPATGAIAATGSMLTPRRGPEGIVLKDGRVLVVGGLKLSSAEVYDPASGRFSATGSMVMSHFEPGMVLLQDGRVLLVDGDAEIYDPETGRFSPTGPMSVGRDQVQPALLPDGRVLVVGGAHVAVGNTYADLYDPRTGTFSKTGPLITPLDFATVTALGNGNVLIAGGTGPDDAILSSAELFEP